MNIVYNYIQPLDCEDCYKSREVVCKGRKHDIDLCIADIIEAINNHPNLRTESSCCGHGVAKGSVICANKNDDYFFIEIDLHTPLKTWETYRPLHEAMMRGKKCRV